MFLTVAVGVGFLVAALIKMYRRSRSNFPLARQGEQIGIPDNLSVVTSGGAGSSGIVPVAQTQTVSGSGGQLQQPGVEFNIVRGGAATGGTETGARMSAKYDKLPLVPNIEDGVQR